MLVSDHLLTNCLLLPSSGDALLRWQNDKEILLFDLPSLGIESGTVFLLIRGSWVEWALQFWFGLVWWDLCVAVVDSKHKIISKSKLQCLNKNKQNVASSLSVQCWILEDPKLLCTYAWWYKPGIPAAWEPDKSKPPNSSLPDQHNKFKASLNNLVSPFLNNKIRFLMMRPLHHVYKILNSVPTLGKKNTGGLCPLSRFSEWSAPQGLYLYLWLLDCESFWGSDHAWRYFLIKNTKNRIWLQLGASLYNWG